MRPKFISACLAATVAIAWAAGAEAAVATALIEGRIDKALRGEIADAIGEARGAPASRLEARGRARRAAADATALMRSEGYYLATVTPRTTSEPRPHAVISVDPGPRFVIGAVAARWSGAPPDRTTAAAALGAAALHPGAPGRAADILAAEARIVAALQRQGYADAKAQPRSVIVDDAARTVSPRFVIAAGAPVRLGAVALSGKGRTDLALVQALVPWKPGEPYAPAKLAELERRLTATGNYNAVTVALAPAGGAGPRPVLVSLVDRPPHTIELGGGYSSSEGSGVDGRYILYNRLHRADTLAFTARLYDIQQKLDAELDLPGWKGADQTLKLGADLLGDDTKAYRDAGGGLRVGVERRFSETSYASLDVLVDYAATSEKKAINPQATPVGEKLNLLVPSIPAALVLDRSNDPLDPTRGWRLTLGAAPTLITGGRNLVYVKTEAQVSGYLPLEADAATVLAARIHVGDLWGGRLPDVPADRRLFAGGGGSVRGYAYQGVGPRLADNTPEGGLSLLEGSFEVRRRLTDRFGVVGFVDAGAVGTSEAPTTNSLQAGAGVGLRYNLGFAPLRVDIATPLDPRPGDPPIQVYLSIGQSF